MERIDAAIAAMNELFNALLDISKLDAGVLVPDLTEFPINHLFKRIETTFAAAAREKGLRLQVVPSSTWVRSDAILLERILLNLVSNAVRYTARGGIVVGCRQRAGNIRLDVWDSGIGIPADQQRNIFGEFYRLAGAERDGLRGLGLGLAIVDRLGRLLGHPIEINSQPDRGSRFSVLVPRAAPRHEPAAPSLMLQDIAAHDRLKDRLIVAIDDDELVLDGIGRLLQGWGCQVVTAASDEVVLGRLAADGRRPDLIISDYQLAAGRTGLEAIEQLRCALGGQIPATCRHTTPGGDAWPRARQSASPASEA